MSAIVLVFALNFFGVFEITLPQSANRGLLAWTSREGDAGSFFQGVFATVLATPCTAPFLGTALGFAFTQSGWIILLMFLAIAGGMSAPYLLLSRAAGLAQVPAQARRLDGARETSHGIPADRDAAFFAFGPRRATRRRSDHLDLCFPARAQPRLLDERRVRYSYRLQSARASSCFVLMLVLVIGSGVYFIGEKFATDEAGVAAGSQRRRLARIHPRSVSPRELAQGRAVFIDFTAAWCVTCKFNETTVLETQRRP